MGHITQATFPVGKFVIQGQISSHSLLAYKIWSAQLHPFISYRGAQILNVRSRDPDQIHLRR